MPSPSYQTAQLGAQSELLACAWLLEQGYEVFRNVSFTGLIDIVAIKGKEILYLDAKTVNLGGHVALNVAQLERGIKAIYVYSDGECSIGARFEPEKKRGRPSKAKYRTLGNSLVLGALS